MTADNRAGVDAAAVLRRAASLGAQRDPHLADFLAVIGRDPANRSLPQVVNLMLDEFEAAQRLAPNHLEPPPSADDLYDASQPPDFEIGATTETGVRYGPRMARDGGTIVISGITGGGKTSAVQNLIVGTHHHLPQVATLVFDVKGDYRCLAALNRPDVSVFRVRTEIPPRLIAPPAGVSLDSWLATFSTTVCAYRGQKKSRHILLVALSKLCGHFGVDRDPTRPWPSLYNVHDYLVAKRGSNFGKEAEYLVSLINELRGVLADSGRALDTSDGIDIETLLKPGSVTVLQMENLPSPAQQVLISIITERILARRTVGSRPASGLEVLIVLDEAQLVLSRAADSESENGVAPIAMHLLRAREFGVGFVIVPHLLPEISLAVLSAARTMFVVGGLSDGASIAVAGQTMNLSAAVRTMIPRLGRGQALVREIGRTYTDAFLVDLDPPILTKNALDEPTRQRLMASRLAGLPTQPSQPPTNYPTLMADMNTPWTRSFFFGPTATATTVAPPAPHSPPPAQPVGASAAATPMPMNAPNVAAGPALQPLERDVLFDAARHRDDWMLDRQRRLNIADYKVMLRITTALQARGVAIVHNIRLGRSTVALLEVTDLGWRMLGLARSAHYIGHGGFVHTVLIARVAHHLTASQWTQVAEEFPVGPRRHPVDVFGRSPGSVATAFEITLSTSNVVSNALHTLSSPTVVQELVFLCPLQRDCTKVETLLHSDPRSAALLAQIRCERIDIFL